MASAAPTRLAPGLRPAGLVAALLLGCLCATAADERGACPQRTTAGGLEELQLTDELVEYLSLLQRSAPLVAAQDPVGDPPAVRQLPAHEPASTGHHSELLQPRAVAETGASVEAPRGSTAAPRAAATGTGAGASTGNGAHAASTSASGPRLRAPPRPTFGELARAVAALAAEATAEAGELLGGELVPAKRPRDTPGMPEEVRRKAALQQRTPAPEAAESKEGEGVDSAMTPGALGIAAGVLVGAAVGVD